MILTVKPVFPCAELSLKGERIDWCKVAGESFFFKKGSWELAVEKGLGAPV